ncbi:MAG: hypothetical protein EKK57_05070 [Proteobacteria bacterium]|nr:MAG: hypothetical protein EKK57_05070 [Pseudomonadota bacterium]
MKTRAEKISPYNDYRLYVTCDNGVTFSGTIRGNDQTPPHEWIIHVFNNSNIKEWFIEVDANEVINEPSTGLEVIVYRN